MNRIATDPFRLGWYEGQSVHRNVRDGCKYASGCWEGRRYNPVFAFAQKLLWLAPLIAALLLVVLLETLGVSQDSILATILVACGALGSFGMFGLSLCCWMKGYSRSGWQDEAAKDYRKNPARSWIRFLSGR